VILKVDFLQPLCGCIDSRGVRFGILTRKALRNYELGTLWLVGEGCIHEKVSSSRDHGRFEPLNGSHQVVELAARLAPSEEHTSLPESSGILERSGISFFASMRIEILLLLLKGFLCHSASIVLGC